jgi:Secretion system C-terminal sorting domain
MKSLLHFLLISLILFFPKSAFSQIDPIFAWQYYVLDSIHYSFDSLDTHFDTSGSTLWKIGQTNKPFFSSGGFTSKSIMTDTVNSYPVNANSSFSFKFNRTPNGPMIKFVHKYQTTLHHDGCVVEFSADSGTTWQNIMGSCQSFLPWPEAIHTDSVYSSNDTLLDGTLAFSGTSNGWVRSRFIFFDYPPVKTTSGNVCHYPAIGSLVFVRFRFVSDSVADNLDGWIIKSLTIEHDIFPGSVAQINADNSLNIFPNPSVSGKFSFPTLTNQKDYTMYITDVLGRTVFHAAYTEQVDLSSCTQGVYFYRITNNTESYSGKLMNE